MRVQIKSKPLVVSATAAMIIGLAGCSGGGEDDGLTRFPATTLASAEARRAAAIYSTFQQLMSVFLVTLRSPDDWSANDGAVLGCSEGGSVTVDFSPGAPPANDRVQYTYDGCIEAVGQIDGTFDAELIDDQRNTNGFWRPSWDAVLTIAGTTFNLDGHDTRIDTNSVSGDYTVNARIASTSTLTAPTGESFGLAQSASTNSLTLTYDVSAGTASFSAAELDFDSAGNPDMNLRALSAFAVSVTAGIGAHSIGVPESGEMIFRRLVTPAEPDIVVDMLSNAGIVDVTVRGAGSFAGDAGQFDWQTLLNNAEFDSSGLRGQ